jgi:uncharacterized protein (DUF1501 family)
MFLQAFLLNWLAGPDADPDDNIDASPEFAYQRKRSSTMTRMNRREFLTSSGAAALFAATPGLAYSQVIGSSAAFDDYRALVCVFLFGGNDSFNMLVPRSDTEYRAYEVSRQNLAIPQDQLLPITTPGTGSRRYSMHFAMVSLQQVFEEGRGAFVANVGPLVEPTTRDEFFEKSVALPRQLFSHNDQQDQWNSLTGNRSPKTGWAGRMADLIRDSVAGQKMATNASLFGNNLQQSAEETVACVMGPEGPMSFPGFSSTPGEPGYAQREASLRVLEAHYGSISERALAKVQRRAIATADTVTAAIDNPSRPPLTTAFPQSQLGTQLRTVARLIAARDDLSMRRQVFFVAAGGFDSHDKQADDQPGLLADVSESLSAFYRSTVELGVTENVTAFTQSDFGRTLTSNGDGTDHAWGGNQIVLGGTVLGGKIYGSYPELQIGGPEDVGGGRFIPSTSSDQYAATLATWFGIADADLDIVAPNLRNFTTRNLGFMA